jgi:hypothetical protein
MSKRVCWLSIASNLVGMMPKLLVANPGSMLQCGMLQTLEGFSLEKTVKVEIKHDACGPVNRLVEMGGRRPGWHDLQICKQRAAWSPGNE